LWLFVTILSSTINIPGLLLHGLRKAAGIKLGKTYSKQITAMVIKESEQ
jgi:hypothetical protein